MVGLIMFGIVCTGIGFYLVVSNLEDFDISKFVIGLITMIVGFVLLILFIEGVSEERGYKEGQKDALNGIQNIEVRNTFVDTTLVKSDTVFIEGFEYK